MLCPGWMTLWCINNVFLTPNEANEAEYARTNTRLAEQRNNPKKVAPAENQKGPPGALPPGGGVSAPRALHRIQTTAKSHAAPAIRQQRYLADWRRRWTSEEHQGATTRGFRTRRRGCKSGRELEVCTCDEGWIPGPVMINVEVNFRLH